MSAKGFACEAADVAGITTAFAVAQVIALDGHTGRDAFATAFPQGGYLDHIEVKVLQTAVGGLSTLTAMLCWDSTGDEVVWTGTISLFASLTTASTFTGQATVDRWYRAPTKQTANGHLYLFLKTDAGTVTLKRARVYWADSQGK